MLKFWASLRKRNFILEKKRPDISGRSVQRYSPLSRVYKAWVGAPRPKQPLYQYCFKVGARPQKIRYQMDIVWSPFCHAKNRCKLGKSLPQYV